MSNPLTLPPAAMVEKLRQENAALQKQIERLQIQQQALSTIAHVVEVVHHYPDAADETERDDPPAWLIAAAYQRRKAERGLCPGALTHARDIIADAAQPYLRK